MKNTKRFLIIFLLINFLVLTGFIKNPPAEELSQPAHPFTIPFNEFISFTKSLNPSPTYPDAVFGLFIPDKFAFEVEQQPAGHPEFVSNDPNHLTQFSLVSAKNSAAFLAHNHLAGTNFAKIAIDDYLITIDQEGTHIYLVTTIENYQALSPTSPYSNFLSLDDSQTKLTATQLFTRIYTPENQLVLQTCLEKDGEPSWGRTFIIAEEQTDLQVTDYFSFAQTKTFAQK